MCHQKSKSIYYDISKLKTKPPSFDYIPLPPSDNLRASDFETELTDDGSQFRVIYNDKWLANSTDFVDKSQTVKAIKEFKKSLAEQIDNE